MKYDINLYKGLGAFFVLTSLTACSVNKYQQPKIDNLPENFRSDIFSDSTQIQENSIAKIPYNEFFTDPDLLDLIAQGITNNNDFKIALKQIEIAALGYSQSKWGNIPVVGLGVGTAAINRPSDNSMNGKMFGQFLGQRYIEDYTSTINISWEADIWGKIKGRKEAALANYLKTTEASKTVQTQVVTQIALGYYNLLMLDTQLDITNQNIELINTTLRMIKKQQELGITTTLSVQQQENARDQILASIPVIKQAITVQENALSVLTGKMPSDIVRSTKLKETAVPTYLSVGVPSEMLSYRPDVKNSELTVRQAFAHVKVAERSLYPTLNITAQGGLNAFEFKNWFDIPGSLFATAAGSIFQPILNGKQLKTQVKQSKIGMEQAEINFKQTVLNAVAEVSNVLASIESADQQEMVTTTLVNRSNDAVATATKLFKNDMATYLDVIVAQNNKLQAELNLAAVKQQKLSAVVNLYRALGGGWQ